MLMRFSVSNFMSFDYHTNEEGTIVPTEYYLYAGRSEQHKDRVIHYKERKVLKFSSIYGANASGKTNLIKAISAGKKILLNTMEKMDYKNQYCRIKTANAARPSLFEYEFTIGEKCFAYGFTVNLQENVVLSEWLTEMENAEERTIFERDTESNQYYFDEEYFIKTENREHFHFFIQDANRIKHTLLLYELERRKLTDNDFEVFNSIFDWFQNKLVIVYPQTKLGSSYFFFGSDNEKLVSILKYLDTGITNYEMNEINESAFRKYFMDDSIADQFLQKPDDERVKEARKILSDDRTLFEIDYKEGQETKIAKLKFQHGTDEERYEYGEESDGTKRLIELLDVILNADKDKVFIIDELDRSLHPKMTIKFVQTFLDFSKNKNTQLIITTHESNLMDLSILRRDEIWFAEKDKNNETILYTLEKFKIRYDKVVPKDYLSGRYGAVPVFQDFDYAWGGK